MPKYQILPNSSFLIFSSSKIELLKWELFKKIEQKPKEYEKVNIKMNQLKKLNNRIVSRVNANLSEFNFDTGSFVTSSLKLDKILKLYVQYPSRQIKEQANERH